MSKLDLPTPDDVRVACQRSEEAVVAMVAVLVEVSGTWKFVFRRWKTKWLRRATTAV
jgi:hypothetical protein